MKSMKKRIATCFLVCIVIGFFALLGAFSSSTAKHDEARKGDLSFGLLSEEQIDIVVDADSPYEMIYSSDAMQGDSLFASELANLLEKSGKSFRPTPDVKAETEYEILIGCTNRELSKNLLSALAAYESAGKPYVWGYAYKDGKLAYTANNSIAFDLGKSDFLALVAEDGTLRVPEDLWVINYMTAEEYEEILRQEEEAERLAAIEALKKLNDAFKNDQFDTTYDAQGKVIDTYKPMIGENGHYQTSPYPAPWVYPDSNQHPRYLLTEDDIPRIKEMMNDPQYETLFINLWKFAELDINNGIMAVQNDDLKTCYDERVIAGIAARAMAYLLTGNELYAYEAIVGIKNVMLCLNYTTNIHMDPYHGASHVMVVLAAVYDWCYPVLTETDMHQMISGSVMRLWSTMEFNYPPTVLNGIIGHGVGVQLLRDYMSLAVAFYDEAPDWWEFVMGRYFYEYLPAANATYKNGWISQGTACYAPIRLYSQLWGAYLIKICTGERFLIDDAKYSAYMLLSQQRSDGKYFQTGDGPRTPTGSTPGFQEFIVSAGLYNDAELLSWVKMLTNDYTRIDIGEFFTMGPEFQLCFISQVTNTFTEDKYESMGLVQYYDDPAGMMVARNSWDSDAVSVLMKIGNRTLAAHEGYEHGTFQIYYKGLLAATSGSYNRYGGDSHYYYLQCTVAHNGLLVFNPAKAAEKITNASGKVTNPASWYYSGSQHRLTAPSDTEEWNGDLYTMGETTGASWDFNSDGSLKYAYYAGDITAAYPDDTVEYVGRRMLTVYTGKADVPMVFVTFDELVSDEEYFEKTFLLHTIREPEIDTENKTATVSAKEGGILKLYSLFGADRIEKVGGAGKAYWINDYYLEDGTNVPGKNCLDEYTPDDNYQNIWGRVQLRSARTSAITDFLTLMYVSDTEHIESVDLNIEKFDNDYVYGVKFDNNVAVFAKGKDEAYKEFSFTTEGKGLYNYYISGIADGTWQVTVDGVSVAFTASSDNDGILTFVAPAGSFTLKPGKDVIGANGGKIQYNSGGATMPEDTPYTYIKDEITVLPTDVTRGEDVFLGWYTTPDFNEDNRVYEVPEGTSGTFKVYAKWLAIWLNEDYSNAFVAAKEGTQTVNGISYIGQGKPGSSFTTNVDEDNRNYLEWIEGTSDSLIYSRSSTGNIASSVSEDKSISFTIEIKAKEGAPKLVSKWSMLTKQTVSGAGISSKLTCLFSTDSSGNVRLGGSQKIASLSTTETTTLRIAVDFRDCSIKAYDESGSIIGFVSFIPPAETEAQTGEQLMKCYTEYLFYWWGDSPANAPESTLLIYKIKMQDSNIFEASSGDLGDNAIDYRSAGGTLSEDAPLEYSKTTPTKLPTEDQITRSGSIFAGWYTTATFDAGTRVYYVPTTATGAFTVYAKWLNVITDENYQDNTGDKAISYEGSQTQNEGIWYNALNDGVTIKTVEGADGNVYLRVDNNTKGDSAVRTTDSSFNIAHFTETAISYEFSLSKADDREAVSNLRLVLMLSKGSLILAEVNSSGEVKLAGSDKVIATLEAGAFTKFRISFDFETGTATAYDENGEILDSVTQTTVPNGFASFAELQRKGLKTHILFFSILNNEYSSTGKPAAILIDDVKVVDGKAFEKAVIDNPSTNLIDYRTLGGTLSDDAPTEYSNQTVTMLPGADQISRADAIFDGWYTSATFDADTRVYYVPTDATGTFTVYAKWLNVITNEDYQDNVGDNKIYYDEGQTQLEGVWYNALNDGVTIKTVEGADGNVYLRVDNNTKGDSAVRTTDSSFNITHFTETAISYEFSLSKADDREAVSNLRLVLMLSKGSLILAEVNSNGEVKLTGSDKILATLEAGTFTKFRMCFDFETGTLTAYGENGEVLDFVKQATVPNGFTSFAELQRKGLKTHILFFSILNNEYTSTSKSAAVLIDDIKITDGRAFEKFATEIPKANEIVYNVNGGTFVKEAPTTFDTATGIALPTDIVRDGYIFGGWYSNAYFTGDSQNSIAAGTSGEVAVYAKWLKIITDENYQSFTGDKAFSYEGSQTQNEGIWYNALNDGVTIKTVEDASGNVYVRVDNNTKGDSAIRTTDTAFNITHFSETAISFELSLSKPDDREAVSNLRLMLNINKNAGGKGNLILAEVDSSGRVKLNGSDKVIATLKEGVFTKFRICFDFETGTATAYDENSDVLDSVTHTTVPGGYTSFVEWQRNGLKTHILFLSILNNEYASTSKSAAILIDDLRIIDGRIV